MREASDRLGIISAKPGLDCSVVLIDEVANGPPRSEQIIKQK